MTWSLRISRPRVRISPGGQFKWKMPSVTAHKPDGEYERIAGQLASKELACLLTDIGPTWLDLAAQNQDFARLGTGLLTGFIEVAGAECHDPETPPSVLNTRDRSRIFGTRKVTTKAVSESTQSRPQTRSYCEYVLASSAFARFYRVRLRLPLQNAETRLVSQIAWPP